MKSQWHSYIKVVGSVQDVQDALNVHSAGAPSSVKHSASLREVCLSTVHGPVKRLPVVGEWMEGGNGK